MNPPEGWRLKVIPFGKWKGSTWGHMSAGSLNGERYGYLAWFRDEKATQMREEPNHRYARSNAEQHACACAAMAEIEARAAGNLEPPPAEGTVPDFELEPPPHTDDEVPF